MTFRDLAEAYRANQQLEDRMKSAVNFTMDDLAPKPYPARQEIDDTQRHNLALDCVFAVDELDQAKEQLQLLNSGYEKWRLQLEARIEELTAKKDQLKRAVIYCVIETDDVAERAAKMTSLVPPPDLSQVSARRPTR